MIQNPRLLKKIHEGYAFSASVRFESISDSGMLYFENPSGSGRTVYIAVIEVVSLAQAWVDIYRGNTVSASGTSVQPVNLNFGSPVTSPVIIEYLSLIHI